MDLLHAMHWNICSLSNLLHAMHWNIWFSGTKGFMNGPIACSALEHLKSSGTKGFMNGPIACNALEHLESSGTKGFMNDLLHAVHWNIWSVLALKVL